MHILIVEDDLETAEFIGRALRETSWDVTHHVRPQEALLSLGAYRFDAIVLDRMLPGMDGVDALKLIRGAGIDTPVLMLTARSGIDDRVEGLEAGADDYLVKPFAMAELIARLKTILRRPATAQDVAHLSSGDIDLDTALHKARRAGRDLDLSPLEFRLLACLVTHEGTLVTRTMLLEKVWGYRFDPKTSLVQTHMSRLRAKLDRAFAPLPERIETVRGAGYILRPPG